MLPVNRLDYLVPTLRLAQFAGATLNKFRVELRLDGYQSVPRLATDFYICSPTLISVVDIAPDSMALSSRRL